MKCLNSNDVRSDMLVRQDVSKVKVSPVLDCIPRSVLQGGWKQVSLIQVAKAKLVSLKLWNDSSFFSKTFFGNKLRFLVNFL